MTSPRAWAYSLIGIAEYMRAFRGDGDLEAVGASLANKLLDRFRHS